MILNQKEDHSNNSDVSVDFSELSEQQSKEADEISKEEE